MIISKFVIIAIIGYLIGSIPFGLLVSRHKAKVDIRQYGSGKIGTTNVLRTVGRGAAALVAVMDISKGVLAVIFARLIIGDSYLVAGNLGLGIFAAEALAALVAVAGHIWSIFLKFNGGRGVATFFGGLIIICPVVGLSSGGIMILSASLSRYASVGSIAGTISSVIILIPLTIFRGYPIEYLVYTFISAVIIVTLHRGNIDRLMSGTERKLGEKAKNVDFSSTAESM
ncbi:glycerol-3-phosphate 1-O-acyltransferase PlsY [Chloroflexota bacterium]